MVIGQHWRLLCREYKGLQMKPTPTFEMQPAVRPVSCCAVLTLQHIRLDSDRSFLTGLQSAKERETAELLARNIIEDLDAIDYNKYYAAMGKPGQYNAGTIQY